MALPNHSYQRVFEDGVVALLQADTTGVNQAYRDAEDVSYTPTIIRGYKSSVEHGRLAVVVMAHSLQNAMLGALGRGAQWRVTVAVRVMSSIAHDPDNDNADRLHGAVGRYMAAVTVSTLNSEANISGASITVHGITATEEEDAIDEQAGTLVRTSAVVIHFGV
jgi:hypothetical protein